MNEDLPVKVENATIAYLAQERNLIDEKLDRHHRDIDDRTKKIEKLLEIREKVQAELDRVEDCLKDSTLTTEDLSDIVRKY